MSLRIAWNNNHQLHAHPLENHKTHLAIFASNLMSQEARVTAQIRHLLHRITNTPVNNAQHAQLNTTENHEKIMDQHAQHAQLNTTENHEKIMDQHEQLVLALTHIKNLQDQCHKLEQELATEKHDVRIQKLRTHAKISAISFKMLNLEHQWYLYQQHMENIPQDQLYPPQPPPTAPHAPPLHPTAPTLDEYYWKGGHCTSLSPEERAQAEKKGLSVNF
jgi:hypothetical protein